MLRETFLFLDGISIETERSLWQDNHSWDSFITSQIKGITPRRKIGYDIVLRKCINAIESKDTAFFSRLLPASEHWRTYEEFKDKAVYLDIETARYGDVTVVGIYDSEETKSLVAGANLNLASLEAELSEASCIITFNGSCFDIPVLNKAFGLKLAVPHIDLRGVCQRVGLIGGLKAIERKIGLKRPSAVDGLAGEDAMQLWIESRSGDEDAMERFLLYNQMDAVNLKELAEYSIDLLWKKVRYGKV